MKKFNIPTRSSKEGRLTGVYIEKVNKYAEKLRKDVKDYCDVCCKEFYRKPHEKTHTCSKECSEIYRYLYSAKKQTKAVACDTCGKVIYLAIYIYKYKDQNHFCSKKCVSIHRKLFPMTPKIDRIDTPCKFCGKLISRTPSEIANHIKEYCDKKCMANGYSFRFSGSSSPTWKGGLCKRFQYGDNWYRMRRLVRERDNFKCVMCGKTEEDNNEQLTVHHIRPFRLFDSYLQANTFNNLVSVCRECHSFIHSNSNINKDFLNDTA